MHLRKVSDGPHEIATRKGQEDARPDEPVQERTVSSTESHPRAASGNVRLVGALGSRKPCRSHKAEDNSPDKECGQRGRHGGECWNSWGCGVAGFLTGPLGASESAGASMATPMAIGHCQVPTISSSTPLVPLPSALCLMHKATPSFNKPNLMSSSD